MAQGARALLRADLRGDRVDLHEGQPLPGRGAQELPGALRGDRVRAGVRAPGARRCRPSSTARPTRRRPSRCARTCASAWPAGPRCAACTTRRSRSRSCSRRRALVVANGGVEHTGSFFVRVYETVSLHLHERAANSFLRAQAVFDTVTAGKMAAAAASAAAVAGGGFAVEGVVDPGRARSARRRSCAAPSARARCPALKTASRSHARPRSHDRIAAHRPRPRAARSRPRASARRRVRLAAGADDGRAPRRPRPAAGTPPPRPSRAPSAASAGASRSGSSAAGEFGFEGP